jgi:Tfp pilus assembly protein PilN
MGGDFATLLHFETTPGLITLATELARRGLAVESAWPMATFLHALPKEWSDSGAVTVVAVQAQRAVAYRHPADGVRSVPVWLGESAVAEVGEWLGELLAQSPEEPVLLVCADAETATALGSFVSAEGYPGVEQITLNEALARPGPFPRYHPAQLLPRTPLFTAQRFLVAASIAFLLAGAWMGTGIVRTSLAERAATRDQQAKLSALRTEVAQLRENAAEIAALRRSLEGGAAGPPCGALLEAVAKTVPASITLTSLRINGRTLAIEGWAAPGTPPTAVEDWRTRLAPANAPWSVTAKAAAAGAFTLNGGFRL